jgi:hypothetical protein
MDERHLLNLRPDENKQSAINNQQPAAGSEQSADRVEAVDLVHPEHDSTSASGFSPPASSAAWHAEHGSIDVIPTAPPVTLSSVEGSSPETTPSSSGASPGTLAIPDQILTDRLSDPQDDKAGLRTPYNAALGGVGATPAPRVGFVPQVEEPALPPVPPPPLNTSVVSGRGGRLPISLGWIVFLVFIFGTLAGYGAVKSRVLGEQMKANLEALETQIQTEVREITRTVTNVRETVTTLESVIPIPGRGEKGETGLQGIAGTAGTAGASGDPCSACVFLQSSTPGTVQSGNFNISGDGAIGGSLGVGTANPNSNLEVYGETGSTIRISTSNDSYAAQLHLRTPGYDWIQGVGSASSDPLDRSALRFALEGSEYFRIHGNGNIGIGTTNPQDKLSVVGGVAVNSQLSGEFLFRDNSNAFRGGVGYNVSTDRLELKALGNSAQIHIGSGLFEFGTTRDTNLYRSAANTLKTDDSFLIQTAQNATGALQVQNQDGGVLLAADTTNSQLTVTNLHSTGVITGQNGPASVQLKSQLASATGLTLSGNEITDQKRSTATSGDGRAAPDSSTGIWEATTNLVANGGFETNTTGWGGVNSTTIARSTARAKFGAASLKATEGGANLIETQTSSTVSGATAGRKFTVSCWVYAEGAVVGKAFRIYAIESGGATGESNTLTSITLAAGWQRVSHTHTVVQNDRTAIKNNPYVDASDPGAYIYLDGCQTEERGAATPYVETNGGTATRPAARVQASASGLSATQGWIAFRTRIGISSAQLATEGAYLFNWRNGGTGDRIGLWWLNSGGSALRVERVPGAGGGHQVTVLSSHAVGDYVTVTAKWTAGGLGLSVNGSAFSTISTTDIPSGMPATFDIGSQGGPAVIDSDILWFASGTGTLTDTDAATIGRFGNGDPKMNSFSSSAAPTMAWDGVNANYEGNDAVARSVLILDDTNLYRESAGQLTTDSALKIKSTSTTAFQIQNGTGTALLIADTQNMTITLGSASATPVLLVLGNKNTVGDPSCTAGAVYYNSNSSQLRGCAGSNWTSLGENKPAVRAYHNTTQSIPHNTDTALAFNSERFDTDAIHDTVTNNSRLTAKTAGKYMITGHMEMDANATGVRTMHIMLNGTTVVAMQTGPGLSGNTAQMSVSTIYELAVNDYVELRVYQTSGGALNVTSTGNRAAEFAMARIAD